MCAATIFMRLRPPSSTQAFLLGSVLSAVLLCTYFNKEVVLHGSTDIASNVKSDSCQSERTLNKNGVRHSRPFIPLPNEAIEKYDNDDTPEIRLQKQWQFDYEETEAETREMEALTAMRAAEDMRDRGNYDKAFKLLRRAAALAPKHADILTRLGEFLEEARRDVLGADALYARALARVPDHPVASAHRQRTASLVEIIDKNALQKIDEKREALSTISDANSALRRAKKEAYFQHVYHTVAIEGNTMTLQQTRSILETRTAVAGKSIDEHNEILGLDAAMKYINSTLIHRTGEITADDIVEIHRRVLGYVDPTEGGYYRRTQVYVGGHIPPGPMYINILMGEFLKWLNSDEALEMHPIRLAALAHYKLVYIHPFTDGNGRTSRLLMNLILMQAGYPPVIILKRDRQLYYQHLQTANEGDVRPFVRFIAECTERTLDLYLWATSEFSHQVPAIGQPAILLEQEDVYEDEIS